MTCPGPHLYIMEQCLPRILVTISSTFSISVSKRVDLSAEYTDRVGE